MTEIFDDIRKLYLFRTPSPPLSEYIEFFSETSMEATRHYIQEDCYTVKLFPSFTPTIWLNMGSPYQLLIDGDTSEIHKFSDILLARNGIVERKNHPEDNIFTIKFLPIGFEAIFGVSQTRIGKGVVNAAEILDEHVIRKIKASGTLEEKSFFLESIFLEKLKKNTSNKFYTETLRKSIQFFSQTHMESKLRDLASCVSVSEKTLYRYFQKAIGTHPKDFLRAMRCRAALSAYTSCKVAFSPYDFGYYDFGHFSKEVKSFTGSSLTEQIMKD